MIAIFDAYDEEFKALSENLEAELQTLKQADDETESISTIRQGSALCQQIHDLIKQMEIEVRSQEGADRKRLQARVGDYRNALKAMQGEFSVQKARLSKNSLMSGATGDNYDYSKSREQRQRLLDTNEKLMQQNETILNAQRVVVEAEEVGIEITDELARNREKIQASRDRVGEFLGVADGARGMISSMQRRQTQSKLVMTFVFFVLLVAIIIAIYYTT